ncbi:hypothetical protein CKM354_001046600 [Cercospora kikuchii]|uniref:Integrase catalytic domain-containing protein n=1 Tax=Cercospora kikuchii TaxID=84275 RepID=A0A9P3FH51_9PEZI|nr:uncharacterized protein CKM354_001046600 [Cercospora kikuchii]GIZ47373.1 hypothetical protein CKM354_001046600 [Cercospora kikuchii]
MDSTNESDKRRTPILTRENWRLWFKLQENILGGKGIFWTISDLKGTLSSSELSEASSSKGKGTAFSEFSANWKKDNARAVHILIESLGQDDQDEVMDETRAYDIWTRLHKKYSKVQQAHAMAIVQEFVTFKMEPGDTIRKSWVHLGNLGRRIAEIDQRESHYKTPETRIKHLLFALPAEYKSTRQAIQAQRDLEPEEILQLLEAEESMQHRSQSQETAMFAKGRGIQHTRLKCHLCGEEHFGGVAKCPHLDKAKRFVNPRQTSRVEKRRSPPRESNFRRRSSPDKDALKEMVKKLNLKVQSLEKSQRSRKFSKKAYAAQEDAEPSATTDASQSPSEDDDVDEVAHLTAEAKGKSKPSEWLLDSCASSHMTDQESLFRELKPLQRKKWIKVGGGYLIATHVGNAVVGGPKGKLIVLKNVLFVPGLGVNLVSWSQFSQQYGVQPPSFTLVSLSGKPVVQTKLIGGVPFIEEIDNTLQELAMSCINQNQENEAYAFEAQEKSQDQWELWHRRLAHFGEGLLRNLHKVSDLRAQIPIPKEHQPCRVCSLAKMKKHRGKETERKPQRLSLVSVDVCGPLPVSRLGYKWWLEIVDNFSRKKWAFPMKSREDAPSILRDWKVKAELQSGNPLQIVKSDGARELLAVLKQWEKEHGISFHTTEAYNSIQNGVVERSIQTSEDHVRAMLEDAHMPIEFWPEALAACMVVRNSLPNGPEIDGFKVSPEEAFSGIQPSVSHFRVWGCKAVVYMDPRSQPAGMRSDKLMNRGKDAVFIGYVPDTAKMWLFWEPDMRAIKAHSTATWFEHEKGGEMELNVPKLNQSSSAPVRNPVGRPPKKPTAGAPPAAAAPAVPRPDPESTGELIQPQAPSAKKAAGPSQTLFVQLPPPPKDKEEYQRMEDPEEENSGEPLPQQEKSGTTEPPESSQEINGQASPGTSGRLHSKAKGSTVAQQDPQGHRDQEGNQDQTHGQKRRRSVSDEGPGPEPKAHSMVTRQVLQKRQREHGQEEEPSAKHHRAFLSQVQGQDWEWIWEALSEVQESAYAAIAPQVSGLRQEVPIPKSYKEAIQDPKWGHMWEDAVQKELTALGSNNTWTEVVPPKGANLVTSKWVFDVKRSISGAIEKFKARLVARGFSQKFGVDFQETFAPTVRHDTLRVFMAVVCEKDLELHQVDVNNAFTESTLQEEIFMIPPPGVKIPPNMVLQILRSLYGLKQAARDWNKLCVSKLKQIGFTQSEVDPCLLIHQERNILILTHVDDIPIAAPKLKDVLWFKEQLGKVFKIKDLGEPEKILGMRLTRDRQAGTLKLDQEHFIQENLAKLGMIREMANPTLSPMDSYESLKPTDLYDERGSRSEYQSQTGTWMWPMVMTRPDIAFSLGRLSSYSSDPAKRHMHALKKLARYLRSSQDLGLMFRRNGGKLIGYSDSDYAMDKADRVSILGSIFFLCGAPVSWMSKKQKSVATSTMEAEYMAMNACAKQSQFLAALLREMDCAGLVGECPFQPTVKAHPDTVKELRPVQIMGDNQAALTLVKDAHTHERSKHIDVAYNHVRHLWWQRKVAVEYVPTKEMVADGLTKPKNGPQFQEFVRQLQLA